MKVDFLKAKILIVDDESANIALLEDILDNEGFTNFKSTQDSREALGMYQELLPDLVLLDLNMPKMGGLEFLQELRKDPRFKSLSVFVLTTSDEERDKIAAYNFNIAGYILKPIEFGQFMDTIKILDAYWTLCEFPNR